MASCEKCQQKCGAKTKIEKYRKGTLPLVGECLDFKPIQSNADRIQAMNDEELAKLITSGELCAICPFCKYYGTKHCYMENEGVHANCDSGIIDWLQSVAK